MLSNKRCVAITPHARVQSSTSTAHLHLATWKRCRRGVPIMSTSCVLGLMPCAAHARHCTERRRCCHPRRRITSIGSGCPFRRLTANYMGVLKSIVQSCASGTDAHRIPEKKSDGQGQGGHGLSQPIRAVIAATVAC